MLLLSTVSTISAAAAEDRVSPAVQTASKDATAVIQQFYTEYIEAWLSDGTRRQNILERYATAALLDELQAAELDYDPFLQAQDCDRTMLEKLTVERDADNGDTYRIGLWDGFNNRYRTIGLQVDDNGLIKEIVR